MKVEDVNIEDDYIVVKPSDTIVVVSKKIAEAAIPDAIVVNDDNEVLGALDVYDIISKVIAPEKDLKSTTAEDIMYAPPPVRLATELSVVEKIMGDLEVSVLPVSDKNNTLLGVITMMDVMEGLALANRSIIDRILGR